MDIVLRDYLHNCDVFSEITKLSESPLEENITVMESLNVSIEKVYPQLYEDMLEIYNGDVLNESIWSNIKSGLASVFRNKLQELDMKISYIDKHIDDEKVYSSVRGFIKATRNNRKKIVKIFEAVVDGVVKTIKVVGGALYAVGSFSAGAIMNLIPLILNIIFGKILFISYAGFRFLGLIISNLDIISNPVFRLITFISTRMSLTEKGLKIKQQDGNMKSYYELEYEGFEHVNTIYHTAHNNDNYILTQIPMLQGVASKLNKVTKSMNYTFEEISKKADKNIEKERAKVSNNYESTI